MKKILLIGIGGVYNYGCEAIVRGTVDIIKRYIPEATIDYASSRVEDDRKRLEDCIVRVIPRPYNRYSAKNIIRKILSYVGIKIYICYDSYSLLKGYDAVFSIGGDIYTLSPDGEAPYSIIKLGDKCEKNGIPYIIWGCSIGPFEKNQKALRVIKKHFSNVSWIVAREKNTIEYLNTIGIEKNVIFAPDPAFFVAPETRKESLIINKIKKIAINLSPLSIEYLKLSYDETIKLQTKTIIDIIEEYDANILLVPHVICDFNEKDDDYRYLERIKNNLPPEYAYKVTITSKNIGFIETKKELITCDLVIAARMHCAINAIAAGVPALFLSYSEKAKGMAKFVYGNSEYVISLVDFSNQTNYNMLKDLFDFFNQNQKDIMRNQKEGSSDFHLMFKDLFANK